MKCCHKTNIHLSTLEGSDLQITFPTNESIHLLIENGFPVTTSLILLAQNKNHDFTFVEPIYEIL